MILALLSRTHSGKTYLAKTISSFHDDLYYNDVNLEELHARRDTIFKHIGQGHIVTIVIDPTLKKSELQQILKLLEIWRGYTSVCYAGVVHPDEVNLLLEK
jgi:hypothetical protein